MICIESHNKTQVLTMFQAAAHLMYEGFSKGDLALPGKLRMGSTLVETDFRRTDRLTIAYNHSSACHTYYSSNPEEMRLLFNAALIHLSELADANTARFEDGRWVVSPYMNDPRVATYALLKAMHVKDEDILYKACELKPADIIGILQLMDENFGMSFEDVFSNVAA